MKYQGQVLIEHLMVLSLVLTPLLSLGARHGLLEFQRARCALLTFRSARARLIRENTKIKQNVRCENGIEETLTLTPLGSLSDPRSHSPLKAGEQEALQLWARLLPSSFSLPDSGSGSEASTSGQLPRGRSRSTDAPESRRFD